MKKILIGILIVLLAFAAYYVVFEGISLGEFKVLSVKQVKEANDKISKEIQTIERLKESGYDNKINELNNSISLLLKAKEEYQDLASSSTEGELKEANKKETYKQEFLWTRIGRHATSQGITLNYSIASGNSGEDDIKNLLFTVNGTYSSVIEFVSALEDDSELGFRIDNFKILPGANATSRQATFTVRNVRVKMENVTSELNIKPETNNQKEQKTEENKTENQPSEDKKIEEEQKQNQPNENPKTDNLLNDM